jgi:hypothetical protein
MDQRLESLWSLLRAHPDQTGRSHRSANFCTRFTPDVPPGQGVFSESGTRGSRLWRDGTWRAR